MRTIWVAMGIITAFCFVMCGVRDWQGDEEAAWQWAGACIGLAIVGMFLYALGCAPWRVMVADGRPMTEFERRPWYGEPEFPIVYDQSIDTRM